MKMDKGWCCRVKGRKKRELRVVRLPRGRRFFPSYHHLAYIHLLLIFRIPTSLDIVSLSIPVRLTNYFCDLHRTSFPAHNP